MDRFPRHDRSPSGDHPDDPLPVESVDEAEAIGPLLEDRTSSTPATASVRLSGRVGASLPVAISAVVLITTVAFGAAAFEAARTPAAGGDTAIVTPSDGATDGRDRPADQSDPPEAPDATMKPAPDEDVPQADDLPAADQAKPSKAPEPETAPEATPKPDAMSTPKPDAKPTPKPDAKPTAKPEPKPTPKPDAKPVAPFELAVTLRDDGRVAVDWSAYIGDGFGSYKIVRSADASVAFPAAEHDVVIEATEDREMTAMKDSEAVAGQANFYRVFAVRKTESGYKVLAATNVAKVVVPSPEPTQTPEPAAMWIEAEVTDAGVVLHWEACSSDGFAAYKVVRSQGPDPSYLPWTGGTEVLAAVGDAGTTDYTDGAVSSGQTWWYRVQSIGYAGDQKVLLGETEAIQVEVP
jgi:hypothetical protein